MERHPALGIRWTNIPEARRRAIKAAPLTKLLRHPDDAPGELSETGCFREDQCVGMAQGRADESHVVNIGKIGTIAPGFLPVGPSQSGRRRCDRGVLDRVRPKRRTNSRNGGPRGMWLASPIFHGFHLPAPPEHPILWCFPPPRRSLWTAAPR
jgi:hypothetical protein